MGPPNDREDSLVKTASKKSQCSSQILGTENLAHKCGSCDGNVKSSRREFSEQAWAALVSWSEVSPKAVDAPLCNDCYFNFRDVLIERADEMRLAIGHVAANAKTARMSRLTNRAAQA